MNIRETCTIIGREIALQIDPNNGDEVKGHLNILSSLQGLNNNAIVFCDRILNQKMAVELKKMDSGLTQTDKKIYLNAACSEEIAQRDLCEYQNKSLHYKIEAMRSILSALKEEQKNSYLQT